MSAEWLDEDGVPFEREPYELASHRCIGCVRLAEEQDKVAKSGQRGLYLFFRKVMKRE